MKRISTLLVTMTTALLAMAQGWPENYGGVMLQGFYWDSYADSKWTAIEQQADELSQYFDLIWIPNSGKTSDYYHSKRNTMGYDPCFWLDHNSCFGTEAELRSLIKTFKDKGTGIIEDVVINHKNGLNTWVDFPDETAGNYSITWDNTNYSAICVTDECNQASNLRQWSKDGKKTTGASDTGMDFGGYRDLDHTNAKVQENVKTYLNFLLNDLGYAGFRYDMTGGYDAKYTGIYNATTKPTYSVGEYWMDGGKTAIVNWIKGTTVDGAIQSAAFDFTTKWNINSAFGNGSWSALGGAALANDKTYARYAVTFVDNHDTYRTGQGNKNNLANNICAANAYILTMPGTPCLFLKHWQSNKGTLKRLIALRKAAGITNQSEIESATAAYGGFIVCVKGSKGKLRLHLGPVGGAGPDGEIGFNDPVNQWRQALEGKNFRVFANKDVDLTAMQAITEEDDSPEDGQAITIPDFCVVNEGETCAFFEAPDNWGSQIKCWRWDNQYNYTGNKWPGVNCEKIGESSRGNSVWKWTLNEANKVKQSSPNEGIIFNDGSNQTADLPFTNGGYYFKMDGLIGTVTPTAIQSITQGVRNDVQKVYTIDGRLMRNDGTLESLPKGLYIKNGQKVIVR